MEQSKTLFIIIIFLFVSGWTVLYAHHFVTAGELIEPTRTLDQTREKTGLLTVASEPPEQEVVLDDEIIGKTPVWQKKIKVGPHRLLIKDQKTAIFIEEDKLLEVSLHDNKFIIISGEEKPTAEKPSLEREETVEVAPPLKETQKEEDKTFFRWKLFINRALPFEF